MIDLLSLEETYPEKIELLEYAKSGGAVLRRIVNDILDFSKMEAGLLYFKKNTSICVHCSKASKSLLTLIPKWKTARQ